MARTSTIVGGYRAAVQLREAAYHDTMPIANGGTGVTSLSAAKAALDQPLTATTLTSSYTVTLEDIHKVYVGTGTWTLTLPSAISAGNGFDVTVKNVGSGTITLTSSSSINGSTIAYFLETGKSLTLVSNGTGWISIGNIKEGGSLDLSIGSVIRCTQKPGDEWLECNGDVYLQTVFPGLYNKLGLIPDSSGGTGGGEVWTFRQTVAGGSYSAIAFGNGIFVQATYSGGLITNIYTSSDNGATWVSKTTVPSVGSATSLSFGNGIFVYAAYNATNTTTIYTSSDNGATWVSRQNIPSGGTYTALTYDDGEFVLSVYGNSDTNLYTSSDSGEVWVLRGNVPSGVHWSNLIFGNKKLLFVTPSTGGTINIYTSLDKGHTWSSSPINLPTGGGYSATTFGNGVFVLAAYASVGGIVYIYNSYDGITWTERYRVATNSGGYPTASFGNGIFVITIYVGGGYTNVYTSSNFGITWTLRQQIPSTVGAYHSLGFGNNTFVFSGDTGTGNTNTVYTSPAGSLYTYDPDTEFKIPNKPTEGRLTSYILGDA